ncbi:phosphatase PAP2 family protein [Kaistella carnis]|uniref:phosphatase PAP2 family protein n=1 Tax=Kaistella carnis TaxID=1241979 RepID=UPI0028AFB757|nr:phosphatase PAP2 family protein [Kaistella carnis]
MSSNYAQQKDSLKIENQRFSFQYKKLYVPAGLMISGIIADGRGKESLKNEIVEERNEHLFGFENHLDDYAQFFPFVAIYGFEIAGMKPRTDFKNRNAILVKGQLVNLGLVYMLKKSLKETRPDGTAYSFPSGHTANVFAGATMLAIEYGEHHKWVPYAAYGVATTVGAMRMINNKHYISDVLFGAGLGILSMKAAYWTHQYKWNRPKADQDPLTVLYTSPKN